MGLFDRITRGISTGISGIGGFLGDVLDTAIGTFSGERPPEAGGGVSGTAWERIAGGIGGAIGEMGTAAIGAALGGLAGTPSVGRPGEPGAPSTAPSMSDAMTTLPLPGIAAPTAGTTPGYVPIPLSPALGGALTTGGGMMTTPVALPGGAAVPASVGALIGRVAPYVLGGAAGALGGLLAGDEEGGGTGLSLPFGGTLFRIRGPSLRPRSLVQVRDPVSGVIRTWKYVGRPILFSGDLAACKRVSKVAARARRASGGRR